MYERVLGLGLGMSSPSFSDFLKMMCGLVKCLLDSQCASPKLDMEALFVLRSAEILIQMVPGVQGGLTHRIKYFGHVTRHNGLEETIMQGMVAQKGGDEKMGERNHIYIWYNGNSNSREDRH